LARVSERHLLRTVSAPLRRGGGQVQFGTSAEHAVVVDGLTDQQIAALEQLDGTHELPRALDGPDASLVDFLRRHDLLVEPDDATMAPGARALLACDAAAQAVLGSTDGYAVVSRRCESSVLVCGRGALPAAVAALLRRAGVARVVVGELATEAADHGDEPAPALVVLTGLAALDPALGVPWRRREVPVLPVVLHGVEAVVGPLVGADGPCLRCLDLTRADLDPAWPLLLGQLLKPGVGTGAEVDGETTLVAVAAGMTAMLALALLDGHGVPVGRSFEIGLPWPRVRQRQWEAHPRCTCGTAAGSEPSFPRSAVS
jgi:hypothetical protein